MWPYINGHYQGKGVSIGDLDAHDFIDVLMDRFVEDEMFEKEVVEARRKVRAELLRSMSDENPGYDSYEQQGRSNDNFSASSGAPLPYIPPTEQTEDGYIGLMPPLA